MSSLPRRRRRRQAEHQGAQLPATPESVPAQALRLAVQLTPLQRHLVVQAGLPGWLGVPLPYQPPLVRPLAVARALACPEFGVLAPVSAPADAFQLTPLGEFIAGLWLTAVLCDPEPGQAPVSNSSGSPYAH